MPINIALAGNPNCGKTTMFNMMTGGNQYVGNWPGVTVEKKSGKLKGHSDVNIVDLPGIYSLSPYTLEEVVTRNYLVNEHPDVIINIVDSTNIERNLYLTTQLAEIGLPMIVALNMTDVVQRNGDLISLSTMQEMLGCLVVETSALKGDGVLELAKNAISLAGSKKSIPIMPRYCDCVEQALSVVADSLVKNADVSIRYVAIKVFERDEKVLAELAEISRITDEAIQVCEAELDDDSESIIINERYAYIEKIVSASVIRKNTSVNTASSRIDKVITNKYLAIPIFAVIMFSVYYISVSTLGAWMTDWTNDVLFGDIVPNAVNNLLTTLGTADWLNSLILDGIIGGVGAVLGFVPQLLVLFLFLAILEDCGYMSRVAFIMDNVFRRFGLSGKSFIPMLIGTGCSVPGIMASRTIENDADRKMTIITTSFIPCGAKLPIIALIAGALFGGAWWVAPSAYFIGIAAVVVSGIILKKLKAFSGDLSPFVMELPSYHFPNVKNVLKNTWDRGWSFIKKAGTIIFISCGLIWFFSNFDHTFHMVSSESSMLANFGKFIAPVFVPLGFGSWEATVATLTGLVAKENVVSTLGVLLGFGEISENGTEIWSTMQGTFSTYAAYSFLVFNLLCAPCVGAIGAIKREMHSIKWTVFAVGYQTIFAYAISLVVYQVSALIAGDGFTVITGIAFLMVIGLVYMLVAKNKNQVKLRG